MLAEVKEYAVVPSMLWMVPLFTRLPPRVMVEALPSNRPPLLI